MKLFYFKKLVSKSGPLPHFDPPNFKSNNYKRIIQMGDHNLWIGNGTSMEYMINLKHMYLRNLECALLQACQIFFGMVILPTTIICYLKYHSQGTKNYYRKELTKYSGPHVAPDNEKAFLQKIREYHTAPYKDPIGRRGIERYNNFAPFVRDTSGKTHREAYIEKMDDYIGKK